MLKDKLLEHDQKVIVTKTAKVMGLTGIVVKCYPMVKDNPEHFKQRTDIRTDYNPRAAREEQRNG